MKTIFCCLICFLCLVVHSAPANELIAIGLAEKHTDAVAYDNITAYEHSMYCKFSDKNASVPYGKQLALPDDEYMRQLRAEYIILAYKIKRQKDSLGQEFDLDTVLPIDATELYTYDTQNTERKHIYATAAERVNNSDADKKNQGGHWGPDGNNSHNRDCGRTRTIGTQNPRKHKRYARYQSGRAT